MSRRSAASIVGWPCRSATRIMHATMAPATAARHGSVRVVGPGWHYIRRHRGTRTTTRHAAVEQLAVDVGASEVHSCAKAHTLAPEGASRKPFLGTKLDRPPCCRQPARVRTLRERENPAGAGLS
jgi:hypothetical protein